MFIDVGSGLGKPNYHAASDPHVRISIGIELEHIRWQVIKLLSCSCFIDSMFFPLNNIPTDVHAHFAQVAAVQTSIGRYIFTRCQAVQCQFLSW